MGYEENFLEFSMTIKKDSKQLHSKLTIIDILEVMGFMLTIIEFYSTEQKRLVLTNKCLYFRTLTKECLRIFMIYELCQCDGHG